MPPITSWRRCAVPFALVVLALVPRAFAQAERPRVGVAFGGESARGIAHVGVIRWFEEHRIPIDVAAGTSMGGLVGGAFATGMSAEELRALIDGTDWDAMFGSSSFPFKNIRRKEDARDFPSRLEFGLKGGIVPPTSLNNGQQVDFLLARIGAAYHNLDDFDELPKDIADAFERSQTGGSASAAVTSSATPETACAGRVLPGTSGPTSSSGTAGCWDGSLDAPRRFPPR